ncbi:MAG: UbiA family prenyltransferase [Alphaproteobacteria bacterium]|nr:UbiA family prenyltransferase [Alphaproteobacteria bacterium]
MKLALRGSMAYLAVGLAVSAFRITKVPLSFSALAAVFCVFCVARLQNDWRDRHHDIGKGKLLATERPVLFLTGLLAAWMVCGALIAATATHHLQTALLLCAMALAALLYSETRRLQWVPISLSALTSASPVFLPATVEPGAQWMLPLFAAAALLIFGREILKDLEDRRIDGGYKWTIPLAYGDRTAKWLVIASVAGAAVAAAAISPFGIAGVCVVGIGLLLFSRDTSPAMAMHWLDAGAALVIGALVMFPPR